MAVISFSREASKDEMGREIDRRGAVIDTLTEERDRLKQWQADQVEVIDEAKALITELNADKKALEAERDQLVKERDEFKRLFEECGIARDCSGFLGTVPDCIEYLDAERDRLALANAELLAGLKNASERLAMIECQTLDQTLTTPVSWMDWAKLVVTIGGEEISALLTKHKATSTEREGE